MDAAFSDQDRLTIRFMADEWGWQPGRIADVYGCTAADIRDVLEAADENEDPDPEDESEGEDPEEEAPDEPEAAPGPVRDENAAPVITLPERPGRAWRGPDATADRLRAALHRDGEA